MEATNVHLKLCEAKKVRIICMTEKGLIVVKTIIARRIDVELSICLTYPDNVV